VANVFKNIIKKNKILLLIIITVVVFILIFRGRGYFENVNKINQKDVLNYYRQYSSNTDPGEYLFLYESLPVDIYELCVLIKKQLIHPVRIDEFPELAGKKSEDETFHSVREMLEELVKRNPKGLVIDRLPEERLRLSCRFHSLLLASILKSQNIPVRVRVGFAGYLAPPGVNKSIDHWICEVWDEQKSSWIYVDPDLCKVNFDKNEFEPAGESWLKVQKKQVDPNQYGVFIWWGHDYIKANMLHDFSCALNNELIYWEGPVLARKKLFSYTTDDLELLDTISVLLQDIDDNFYELKKISLDKRLGNITDYPRY